VKREDRLISLGGLGTLRGAIGLMLLLAGGMVLQASGTSADRSDAVTTIERLRQLSKELSEAVRRFHSHLDEAIARYDHGYRPDQDRQVHGADAGIAGGPPDIMLSTVRKFAAFRMLAMRSERYEPPALQDLDQIEALILSARKLSSESSSILRRILVVSVKDLDPRKDSSPKTLHDQLIKGRAALEEAAKQAYLALPIDIPEGTSPEERKQKAWDLLVSGSPVREGHVEAPAQARKPAGPESTIPLRIAHRKRFTLVSEPSYRMALTDSGLEDGNGRHIFYQEEWVQRGMSVIRSRWRVAVDATSNAHILIKRYPLLEMSGVLDDLYFPINRDSLWYLEPAEEVQPAPAQVESALSEVEASRAAIGTAVVDFRNAVRYTLARHDQRHAAATDSQLDAGMSESLRQTLFTIRAHLAGVPTIIEAENKVRQAIGQAVRAVADLEELAAWDNRLTEWAADAAEFDRLLQRSDREIDLERIAETEALRALPPDATEMAARFPELQKDTIVRIRRLAAPNPGDGLVRFLQEIWCLASPMPGLREVRRSATLVAVDPGTGDQMLTGSKTKYYARAPGEPLEQAFDEYSADDLLIAGQT
jgi:hypothetical protein